MPSTEWTENVAPDEDARFTRLAETLRDIQRRNASAGRASRGLHAKAHGGLVARFEVLGGLPDVARQGLFAAPRTFSAYVRFSNGSGRAQPDKAPDVRGIAIKVVGVDGEKIIPGLERAKTQDFLLIHTPSTPFRDADGFVALIQAASGSQALLLPRLALALGPFAALAALRKMIAGLGAAGPSVAEQRFYSALPIRWGTHAAKLDLRPIAAPRGNASTAPHRMTEDLVTRLGSEEIAFELRAQFFEDEARTPIEDASVEWREQDAPFVPVARLTIPPQDPSSERGQRIASDVESFSFDPWHALVAHRPLGAMMRARSHAYRLSTAERVVAPEPETLSLD